MTNDFFDIDGQTYIIGNSPSNDMKGNFSLAKQGYNNIDNEVTIRAISNETLDSTVNIRIVGKDDIDVTTKVMYADNLTVDAEVEIVALSTIDAEVEIRPNTVAYGKFQLIEPPILNYKMPPLADVFTRDYADFQAMNFGQEPIMYIGKGDFLGTQENYSSFIHFDIANFGARKIIKTAKLKLYYFDTDNSFNSNSNIELHEIARTFSEQGTTYYNQPYILNKLFDNFSIDTNGKFIEFEISDFVKDVYDGLHTFNGFAITTNDNKSYKFYTKESSKSPELNITYIDKNINASVGFSDLSAETFIQGVGKDYRDFNMTVKSVNGSDSIDGTMYVHKYADKVPDDIDVNVTISNPHLNGQVTVVVSATDNIDSNMTVRQKMISDRDMDVTISQPHLDSTVFVKYANLIDSNVTIRVNSVDDIDMDTTISNPTVNATMNIFYHDNKDIDGQVTVRVMEYNYLDAELIIKSGSNSDVSGDVTISNPHIQPNVTVRVNTTDYLNSNVSIRGHYSDIREADVTINNPHINADVVIVESNYRDADVYIKYQDTIDMDVDIVGSSRIDATVDIRVWDDINMEVSISNPTIDASLMIPYRGVSDRDFSMQPRVRAVNDISLQVRIKGIGKGGAYGFIL